MAEPFPKSKQLARGERRYRRKVASPKQWQAIIAAKAGLCRLVRAACEGPIQYHHLVPRVDGGDDVPENIVPLCQFHHDKITRRDTATQLSLLARLTAAERGYLKRKGGSG